MFTSVVVVLLLTTLSLADDVQVPQHPFRVVCLMSLADGEDSQTDDTFTVADSEPALPMCTHLVYSYLSMNNFSYEVYSKNPTRDFGEAGVQRMVSFKNKFPYLKTMIGVGGENDQGLYYSKMAAKPETRSTFVDSVVTFLLDHGLDGMDFDWRDVGEFPGDKQNFVKLVKELRQHFDKHSLILSLSVQAYVKDAYLGIEPRALGDHAHFLNLRTSYISNNISQVRAQSPAQSQDNADFVSTLIFYVRSGVPPQKMNFGIFGSGIIYELADENATGDVTEMLFLNRYILERLMFCKMKEESSWVEEWDDVAKMPFSRNGVWVVSHENDQSIVVKAHNAIKVVKLGGIAFYGVESDDFRGHCAASGGKFPMLRLIDEYLVLSADEAYAETLKSTENYNARYFWNGENQTIWREDETYLGWVEN